MIDSPGTASAPDPLDGLAETFDRAAFAAIASMTGGLSQIGRAHV